MGLIIDTCVFIQHEKSSEVRELSALESDEEVYISAVTVSELLVGVHRANTEARKLKRASFVESILSKIPTLDFNEDVARIHAELYVYMLKKGNMIGSHDLIISATALFFDCCVLTYNSKEFKRVPGLKVLAPSF